MCSNNFAHDVITELALSVTFMYKIKSFVCLMLLVVNSVFVHSYYCPSTRSLLAARLLAFYPSMKDNLWTRIFSPAPVNHLKNKSQILLVGVKYLRNVSCTLALLFKLI